MQNKITGVIGPKGSGKTHEVAARIEPLPRVVVFDMVHEAGYLKDKSTVIVGNPHAFGEALRQPEFHIIYRPTIFRIENDKVHCPIFNTIVKLCYIRGNCLLVIEEAHLVCNAVSCPAMLMTANLIGRHRALSLMYISQSFAAVTRPLTRNTDEFLFWRIIEPGDLDGIRDRCGMETMATVKQLRKLEDHRKEGGEIIPGEMVEWNIWNGLIQ
jgi:hypothetical protein